MKDVTIIIPVYEEYKNIKERLNNAINSAVTANKGEGDIIIVGPKSSYSGLEGKSGIIFIENIGETDFCSQVNLAVEKCNTKYFSVLEYDDEYMPKWFDNVEKYIKAKPEVQYFIPLNEAYIESEKEKGAVGYINEPVWASSFSEELGFIDLDCLTVFSNFNMTGAVIEKDCFIEDGGLKPSMKISFWYEYMMRTAYLGRKMYVIPKVGYNHYLERPGSLMTFYKDNVPQEEAEWWIALAQQEYFFKKDRKKTYEE